MEEVFRLCDELGPAKVIHVYEPGIDLKAILVIDNIALGPAIGGVRMAVDVSLKECARLARAMTLKNAAAGIPHGGGKAVLIGDPKMPQEKKARLIRGLAKSLRRVEEYVFAPDMGTDEECMAWVRDEIARVVALPRELGGIPLDEIGATGWGVTQAVQTALEYAGFELSGARVVIQGFGAVGRHTARFLAEKGAVVTGVCDSRGTIYDAHGLELETLIKLKNEGRSVIDYPRTHAGVEVMDRDAVVGLPCDIWIPAARPDVVRMDNVHRLKTRLVVEAANIPFAPQAEDALFKQGILYIPDFIANAGGVICAAMEYHGGNESSVFAAISDKIHRNTALVLHDMKEKQLSPRRAAEEMALARLKKAMGWRRFSLFSSAPGFL